MAATTSTPSTSQSSNKNQKLELDTAQHKSNQAATSKQVASPKPTKVVKPTPLRRREKASLFHKPQKRSPLVAIGAAKLNALGNKEILYDLVKPSPGMRPHKDIYTVPSARGYKRITVTKIMAAPKTLIAPRAIDNSASKELLELFEKGRAEKQRQKEIDALFN
ncbi:hypothetical protein AYO20_08195 [Fonsecaea nubica]|uniref:Uncharacterized protein n=1 Tax=Fonsecaea nubica TaxID=856822 RepID=A0A178CR71_9EURO|nr:hypothetical protein AYO20_08195 [Fonsecaea nubica]OAL31652.1 hypothetical protein AYO20_08195 [Fonsecaea nubica]